MAEIINENLMDEIIDELKQEEKETVKEAIKKRLREVRQMEIAIKTVRSNLEKLGSMSVEKAFEELQK